MAASHRARQNFNVPISVDIKHLQTVKKTKVANFHVANIVLVSNFVTYNAKYDFLSFSLKKLNLVIFSLIQTHDTYVSCICDKCCRHPIFDVFFPVQIRQELSDCRQLWSSW